MQLVHDIAAADELAADINLRDSRPVGVTLDPVSNRRVGQDILTGERNTVGPKNFHGMG